MADTTAILSSSVAALTGIHAGSFTVAFWLNPDVGGVLQDLIFDRAWKVVLNADNTITFTILDSISTVETSVTTSDVVLLADWNHVVVIYNTGDTTISIFLNGVKDSTTYTDAADDSVSQYSPVFQLGHTT